MIHGYFSTLRDLVGSWDNTSAISHTNELWNIFFKIAISNIVLIHMHYENAMSELLRKIDPG